MFIWPQEDGSVTYTGSFNKDQWDAYQAEHAKAKAPAKAEPKAEPVKAEPKAEPAKKTTASRPAGKAGKK